MNPVEIRSQLSHNGHLVDGELVGSNFDSGFIGKKVEMCLWGL
jgi:hypothetical protein